MSQLLSINTGVVVPLIVSDSEGGSHTISREPSAIQKQSVSHITQEGGPARIACNPLGIDGDEQADHSVHGGLDKAVYCYPFEHYQIWKREISWLAPLRDEDLFGVVGENLSISGILEDQIFIGDQIAIGNEVLLQVTKPREPCFKFNARMKFKYASRIMAQHNICGWYCRVLSAGTITAGDAVHLTPGAREITVAAQSRWLAK